MLLKKERNGNGPRNDFYNTAGLLQFFMFNGLKQPLEDKQVLTTISFSEYKVVPEQA